MTRTWKIDKNIPIPPIQAGGRYVRESDTNGLYVQAAAMDVNDSIGGLTLTEATNFQTYWDNKVTPERVRKHCRRREPDGTYRVWRIR